MALPSSITSLDEVAEPLREHYIEATDSSGATSFTLATEGGNTNGSEKQRLQEFRANNINLMKEKQRLLEESKRYQEQLKAFEGIDPEKYRAQIAKANSEDERRLIEEGNHEELVQRRMRSAVESHAAEVKALTAARDKFQEEANKLRTQVNTGTLRNAVQSAIDSSNLRLRSSGALHDLQTRVSSAFTIDDDGNPRARDNQFSATGEPLTVADHISRLASSQEASHLFESAGGGGSEGGRRPVMDRGRRVIDPDDPVAIGRAIDDIAAGKAVIGKRH